VNKKTFSFDNFSVTDILAEKYSMIQIYNTRSSLIQFECLLIQGFKYYFNKKYYFGKRLSNLLKYTIDSIENEVSFNTSDEYVDVPLLDGILEFIIPSISWSIKGITSKKLFATREKPFWYEEFKQDTLLKITTPIKGKIEAYCSARPLVEGSLPGTFFLGQTIWGNDKKYAKDEIKIILNGNEFKICDIIYRPLITQKPQIIYNADQENIHIDFSVGYIGPDAITCSCEFDNGNCLSIECRENVVDYHTHLDKDIYKFRMFWMKSSAMFGISNTSKILIYESSFSYGAPEEIRFTRKTLKIGNYADYDNIIHQLGTDYFIKNIKYYKNADGFEQYSCDICRNTYTGLQRLFKGFIEIIRNQECLLYFFDKDEEELSEFIFCKEKGFIYKEQTAPSSLYITVNYLTYKEER
jgi:hypothetical protein